MKQTKFESNTKLKTQCEQLGIENEKLKTTLNIIQEEFQCQIDGLKDDLKNQLNQRNSDVSLDSLLKQLEIEDESVRDEISRIMNKYKERRSDIFGIANQ